MQEEKLETEFQKKNLVSCIPIKARKVRHGCPHFDCNIFDPTVSASLSTEVWADLPVQTHPLGERRSSVSHDAQRSPTAKPDVGPHICCASLPLDCTHVSDLVCCSPTSSSGIRLPCMLTSQRRSSRRGRTRFKPSIRKPSSVKSPSCFAPRTASWVAWQIETFVSLMSVRLILGVTSSSMVLRR